MGWLRMEECQQYFLRELEARGELSIEQALADFLETPDHLTNQRDPHWNPQVAFEQVLHRVLRGGSSLVVTPKQLSSVQAKSLSLQDCDHPTDPDPVPVDGDLEERLPDADEVFDNPERLNTILDVFDTIVWVFNDTWGERWQSIPVVSGCYL